MTWVPGVTTDCDLLVVGSGAAGLAAAVSAAASGLNVLVVEKDDCFGGATAWSGGWMWVPGNPLARRAGIEEDPQQPRTYLRHELGHRYDPERVDAFLDHCGEMVAFFEQHTALQFVDGNAIPDMHGNSPGAATGGHQVIAAPYDGREIGDLIHKMRRPMRETALAGMPIMAGADLGASLNVSRSFKAFAHVTRRIVRHAWDLAVYRRSMQLVNGVALVARLLKSARDLGVTMQTLASVRHLLVQDGAVCGAMVHTVHGDIEVRARCGVVLATGGFPHDISRRQALFPRTPTGREHLALPPLSCSGDGLRLGEAVGGVVETDLASPVAWAPVSLVHHSDGTTGHFPHIIERGKPGLIGVLSNGRRFVNEAGGYYDYTSAMVAQAPQGGEVASWLLCDHRFLRRYGLGWVKPFPMPVGKHVRSGYLKRANSIEQLARECGIDETVLTQTVSDYNRHAKDGRDPAFGRGTTAFNLKQGDPTHGPNPCVAPIERPPYYAVKVQPGCFGTFAGLKTNAHAQVLSRHGDPIRGLYAAGADMASVMGGFYPSGGINLGPAMTFGFIAGRHAAIRS